MSKSLKSISLMSKSLIKSLIKNQYIMKKFYHLLVTSYKLQVERFKRFTSYLIPLFCFLPFFAFAQATITNVDFSCSAGTVTVTYDLTTYHCNGVNVTLEYSSDECTWLQAESIHLTGTGTGLNQTTGSYTFIWDNTAAGVSYGKYYFRVIYPYFSFCENNGGVMINGVCWAKYNLNEIGEIYENHAYSDNNSAALYQWGRRADGHAARNSTLTTDLSSTDNPGHNMFIRSPSDWHTAPGNDFLWNSGTESCPIKTANDPCPDGWRVPTQTELETLGVPVTNQTYVTKVWQEDYESSGIKGYLCADNAHPYNFLFLPAAGNRVSSSGSLVGFDTNGRYWSSTPSNTSAYNLSFSSDEFKMDSFFVRAVGFSVRCVAEN